MSSIRTTVRIMKLIVPLAALVILTACAPVISKGLRSQASPGLDFGQVLADPDSYRDRVVIFSGIILEAVNTEEGTLLTVLQKPAGPGGRPVDADQSGGRFLALIPYFVDVAIYAPGRAVTVAGRVIGKKPMPLGRTTYGYPYIRVEEIHLWRDLPEYHFGFGFRYQFFNADPIWYPY